MTETTPPRPHPTIRRLLRAALAAGYVLAVAWVFLLLNHSAPSIGEVTVRSTADSVERRVVLPFIEQVPRQDELLFTGWVHDHTGTLRELRIVPDDCLVALAINHHPVALDAYPGERLCNSGRGISIDIGRFVVADATLFELRVSNRKGGNGGLRIGTVRDRLLASPLALLLFALLLPPIWLVMARLRLPPAVRLLLIAALALRVFYLGYTDFMARSYDVVEPTGHLDYIRYLAERGELPPPGKGWEYHQPPLYYCTAAAIYRGAVAFGLSEPLLMLQLFALTCSAAFLLFAALTVREFAGDGWRAWILTAAVAFWPAGIIHAVRLGNDPLLHAFWAGSLYFAVRWWRSDAAPDLLRAAILAALALTAKVNGIIAVATVASLLARARWRAPPHRAAGRAIAVLLLGAVVSLAPRVYHQVIDPHADWMVGESLRTAAPTLRVDNDPRNFIYFDVPTFLSAPYLNVRDDATGRRYFWNTLLKTSLFGEFDFGRGRAALLATLLSALLLGSIPYAVAGLGLDGAAGLRRHLPLLLCLLWSLLALVSFRLHHPLASNADFRFIFPAITPAVLLAGAGIELARRRGYRLVEYAGYGLLLTTAAASVAFFVAVAPVPR